MWQTWQASRSCAPPSTMFSTDVLAQIIALKLGRIRDRVAGNHKATFLWDDSLVEAVLSRCTEVDSGARNVDHILNGTLLPEVAESVLAAMAEASDGTAMSYGADPWSARLETALAARLYCGDHEFLSCFPAPIQMTEN